MNDFLNSVRVTNEDKKLTMSKLLSIVIYSTTLLSLNEILELPSNTDNGLNSDTFAELRKEIKSKLNENEILATYSLAKEMKISMLSSNYNKKLFEYLEWDSYSLNNDKLLKFINEVVKDIESNKKSNRNVKWALQTNKIFSRLEGKNTYEEDDEDKFRGSSDNKKNDSFNHGETSIESDKIIKLSEYLTK